LKTVRTNPPISYAMFLQILTEAEERARNHPDPRVRANSQETVDLCLERMRLDGITREQLQEG
jgi:hypothetical protein